MDTHYLDKIIPIISQYKEQDLISSSYWDVIYHSLYLTHELLKLKKFTLINKINPAFFEEHIICIDLLSYEQKSFKYIPDKILKSESFWIQALEKNYTYISKIPHNILLENKQLSFWIFEKFYQHAVMEYFPEKLKDNFEICYLAVSKNTENFKFFSEKLKNNLYIFEVLYRIHNKNFKYSDCFKLAGNKIHSNYKFAKKSILENPSTFAIVDKSLKNDIPFFLEMLNESQFILQYANFDIKKNETYVSASIAKNPLSIEFAADSLKSSLQFLISIHKYIENCDNFNNFAKFIDSKLFSDFKFIEKYFNIISKNSSYYLLGENICSDQTIMKNFVFKDIKAFGFASSELKSDIEFIKDCYYFHNQIDILKQFNIDSPQSKIFTMLDEKSLNDIIFIKNLYENFRPIFKNVIFPILNRKKTILTDLLSNEIDLEKGLVHLIERFDLKNKLEEKFDNSQSIIKTPIHKI